MVHVKLLFPSLYLGAADLASKDVTLTIAGVNVEELRTERGAEKKPILRFKETNVRAAKAGTPEKAKRLVLNRTNALVIAAMHGNEVNDWVGRRVTMYATQASAFGKQVDCIRIRPVAPPANAPGLVEPELAKEAV